GSMLSVGRDRAEKNGLSAHTDFVEANAEALPFPDGTFDAYTIAFGIRNVPRIEAALTAALRVLKVGGRFLCLEFSAVDMPLLENDYEAWSLLVIPCISLLLIGYGKTYPFFVQAIRESLYLTNGSVMLPRAGVERATLRNFSGGFA